MHLLQRNTPGKNHSNRLPSWVPNLWVWLWKQKNVYCCIISVSKSKRLKFLRSFESVIDNINQCNPYFVLTTGDFNVRSSSNTHTQVKLFNEIWTNIFTNFVPNKLITVDDRDPPWVTENIKKLLKEKSKLLKNTLKTEQRKKTMKIF